MIVSKGFEGDSLQVANAQRDVYHEALKIIVKHCNKYAQFARRLIPTESTENWGRVFNIDHRTLQFQHDLLAMAWRYESNASQRSLLSPENSKEISGNWLAWLDEEVKNWFDFPEFIRLVQVILTNQNNPIGYEAETRLSLAIMDRFRDAPWDAALIKALENELTENSLN